MNKPNTGGPAFPCANDEEKIYNWIYRGMTLRDYFAAKAIPVAFKYWIEYHPDQPPEDEGARCIIENAALIADSAYEIADAMLRARGA